MNHVALRITGTVVGAIFGITTYHHIRRKKRDELASTLLIELTKVIDPSSSGFLGENAFNIQYLDKVLSRVSGTVLRLKQSAATGFANQIHAAWKPWYTGGDNEDQVYSVFRKLKDKVQVAQVAKAYQNDHGVNLIDKLKERLDKKEIKQVLAIVKALPSYRTV